MDQSLKNNFIHYVSRNVLGMMSLSLYILADTFFVAQALGAKGLTALNLSISIFSFMNAIGLMLGIGGATRFSILVARKKEEEGEGVFASIVKFTLGIGLIISLIGIFGAGALAQVLGADIHTFEMTRTYLSTILTAGPFFLLNNVFVAFVRNDQGASLSMKAMLVGSLSNILLDYIFMFPLNMGIFGAAFATSLSPLISLSILTSHFGPGKRTWGFLKNKVYFRQVLDGGSLGLSAFIIEVSSGIVLLSFNFILLSLAGNIGVAAYGIVANIALVAISFFTGVGQGIQPLISSLYGSNKKVEMKKIRNMAFLISIAISLIIYMVSFVFTDPIVSLFNKEGQETIALLAREGIRIYFLGFIFAGLNICLSMYLSASEKARPAFVLSISRGLILILPSLFILSRFFGIRGVWLCFVVTELLVSLLGLFVILRLERRTEGY